MVMEEWSEGQQAVALALARGATRVQAAVECEVGERTIYRWLTDRDYVAFVARLRAMLVAEGVGRLAARLGDAAGTMGQVMDGTISDDTALTRLKAAHLMFADAARFQKDDDLQEQVAVLRRVVSELMESRNGQAQVADRRPREGPGEVVGEVVRRFTRKSLGLDE
jgi:hypothetical protein